MKFTIYKSIIVVSTKYHSDVKNISKSVTISDSNFIFYSKVWKTERMNSQSIMNYSSIVYVLGFFKMLLNLYLEIKLYK